jgi:hypothetical protein
VTHTRNTIPDSVSIGRVVIIPNLKSIASRTAMGIGLRPEALFVDQQIFNEREKLSRMGRKSESLSYSW